MSVKYRVLCIGVNVVPLPKISELDYAEKDAKAFAKYVETLKHKADVTLLTGKDATRTNILDWVKESSIIQEDLNIIIFFAGHGSAEKDEKTRKLERCLWIDSNVSDNRDSHRLKTSEILNLLTNPRHKLIFIIDACYNFAEKQIPALKDIFEKFKESERQPLLKRYAIISASAVYITALEDHRLKHGVLSYYILRTLSGKYTFFLRKKIAFLKFLEILEQKVRNHRFITDTGRKHPLSMLLENGIMVHLSDKEFHLPILEPRPWIPHPEKNRFLQKISKWTHFFTCTRLRTKIYSFICALGMVLMLTVLAHDSVVRIHFQPRRYAEYSHLLGFPAFTLDKITGSSLGLNNPGKVSLYLFKHNWINALLPKLNDEGKIVLLGNLLGEPLKGVDKKETVIFALRNREDIFYWDPEDVSKFLRALRDEYKNFNNKKWEMLQLLAVLGKKGNTAARSTFHFKKETDQRLRNLFLKHFYSLDFLEKKFAAFNRDDLLVVLRNNKQLLLSSNSRLREKIEKYLGEVVQSLSELNPNIEITDTERLSEIYEKLEILACFGNSHFQDKASAVFKKNFAPGEALSLLSGCLNFNHTLWVLDRYYKYLGDSDLTEMPREQWQSIESFLRQLPAKEKSRLGKILVDNHFHLIPNGEKDSFLWSLPDSDPGVIGLSDWEKWLKNRRVSPYLTLIAIVKLEYPGVFQFIETHYDFLKGRFSEFLLEALYKMDKRKTVKLVKKLYPLSPPDDRLFFSVFLYNKNHPQYSAYIVDILKEAAAGSRQQDLLLDFYDEILNKALLGIAQTDETVKEKIRCFLKDRKMFYGFFKLIWRWWPDEAKRMIRQTRIPRRYTEGIPFLRVCEKLPHPYRKEMLLKICRADMDETFKLNAESSLATHYPEEFLKLIENRTYDWNQFTRNQVLKAYQALSFETLKQELISNFKTGMYWKIGFICDALIKKETGKELDIEDLRRLLAQFHRPVERILLRPLRFHLHKRFFQEPIDGD